eukprot:Gregarina_sp_Poly_1__3810@NODE_2133_length_2627_cov_4_702734_g1373_i0_p1_GENE_NODE_2133_length_2627_cov_4_702734_g1373_i0NODE_2133_length_2627_cov_4_702734_g1373_i0_p1_ORF_typecomplete_len594_score67_77_NODE_2133_length_2627_cov_4_702734_g1373_i02691783
MYEHLLSNPTPSQPAILTENSSKAKFLKLFETLKSQKECVFAWNLIKESPVKDVPISEEITDEILLEHFLEEFTNWRNFPLLDHNHSSPKCEALKLIEELSPFSENRTLSNESSLVLAFLMEKPDLILDPKNGGLVARGLLIFQKNKGFTTWLRKIVQNEPQIYRNRFSRSFCVRVAFRYYILERLRLSPTLLSTIRNIQGWECADPVKEIWNLYLDKYLPSPSTLDPMTSLGHNSDISKNSTPSLSLSHLKFLFTLLAQEPGCRIPPDSWALLWLAPPNIDNCNRKFSVDELWQNFCEYLGISQYLSRTTNNETSSNQQQTSLSHETFLLDSASAMFAEARGGWVSGVKAGWEPMEWLSGNLGRWESTEWLLLLSVYSIFCENKDPVWSSLKSLESTILTHNTIVERVFFRYFLLIYGRNNKIEWDWIETVLEKLCEFRYVKEDFTQLKVLTIEQFEEFYLKINQCLNELAKSDRDFQKRSKMDWDDLWLSVSKAFGTSITTH